jgi:hypothetical protein
MGNYLKPPSIVNLVAGRHDETAVCSVHLTAREISPCNLGGPENRFINRNRRNPFPFPVKQQPFIHLTVKISLHVFDY